jgi:chemosensory pili system protein ChpC
MPGEDKQKQAVETLEPVRCLVVPAEPGILVIPSAAVAEVVPLNLFQGSSTKDMLGYISWRGLDVPVYTMEGLTGKEIPDFGKRSKACIFYPWKGSAKNKFFAIATNHDPRPRLLGSEDIQASDDNYAENAFVKASFLFDGESAIIPDLQAISQQTA